MIPLKGDHRDNGTLGRTGYIIPGNTPESKSVTTYTEPQERHFSQTIQKITDLAPKKSKIDKAALLSVHVEWADKNSWQRQSHS